MADTFLLFMKQENQLAPAELLEAEEIVKELKRKSGDTDRMCELGVKWVIENPSPMKLSSVEYKR